MLVLGFLASTLGFVQSAPAQDADAALAQHFRPYLKTTLDDGADEPHHPTQWQWLISRSNMFQGSKLVVPFTQLRDDNLSLVEPQLNANWKANNAGASDPDLTLKFANSDDRAGEPWNDVIQRGHGFYAHVEHFQNPAGEHLVNIEYTIVWARNDAIGSHHDGDLTTAIVVYDADADKVIRIIYSIHGCVVSIFEVGKPSSVQFETLDGLDGLNGAMTLTHTKVLRADIRDEDTETDGDGKCAGVYESDDHVFFAEDPDTHLFEHPVLYAENSSHELWPNASGWLSTVPAHQGDGVSFLPNSVEVLGTIDQPNPADFPFIFYNGKFGDDPAAIVLHKSWFWPNGRDNNGFINVDRFSDKDPYATLGGLAWPPVSGIAPSGDLFVRPENGSEIGVSADGSLEAPFTGLAEAYSTVPAGWTLHLTTGAYRGPITLDRRVKLVGGAGPVTIGQP